MWIEGWNDPEVEAFYQKANNITRGLAVAQLFTGAFAIAFLEKTLKINQVVFPNSNISDSGQLIPLLINIFTLISTVFCVIRTIMK